MRPISALLAYNFPRNLAKEEEHRQDCGGLRSPQIFVARSPVGLLERLRGKDFTEDIVRLAQDLQVTVVADRSRGQTLQ
jgi:hypothetical protein